MKTLIPDILTTLQNATYPLEIPDDHIRDSYGPDGPDFSKPYIIVHEVANFADVVTFTHKEEFSQLTYDIEIYCRQATIGGVVTPSKSVAFEIAKAVDEAISTNLGLVRVASPAFAPYTVDSTVARYFLTYEGVLDLTHDYIYRG